MILYNAPVNPVSRDTQRTKSPLLSSESLSQSVSANCNDFYPTVHTDAVDLARLVISVKVLIRVRMNHLHLCVYRSNCASGILSPEYLGT